MAKMNSIWAFAVWATMASIVLLASVSFAFGQENRPNQVREPVYRTAEGPTSQQAQPPAPEHPLAPVLKMAYTGLDRMDREVTDYTATLVKRERIDGKLNDYEYIYLKVRQKPFSVYMYFLGPKEIKGREVLYIAGRNKHSNGTSRLKAHEGTGIQKLITVDLLPTSGLAMRGQRYPITEIGIRTLTKRLIEVGEEDMQYGECEVKYFREAKVQDRVCTCIQVVHPVRRKNFRFHLARVYIDDELQIPIRYESYDWPREKGGRPVLLEEYTYMKLKLNPGLEEADFDADNPNYKF